MYIIIYLLKRIIFMEDSVKSESNYIQAGKWSDKEHQLFLEAYFAFGHTWKQVQSHIKTRNCIQIRCHWQKFYRKIKIRVKKYKITKIIHLTEEIKKIIFYELFSNIDTDSLLVLSRHMNINLSERQKELFDEIERILLLQINDFSGNSKVKYDEMFTSSTLPTTSDSFINTTSDSNDMINNENTIFTNSNKIRKDDVDISNDAFNIKKKTTQRISITVEWFTSNTNHIDNVIFIENFKLEEIIYLEKLKSVKSLNSSAYKRKQSSEEEETKQTQQTSQVKALYLSEESPDQSFFRKCNFIQVLDKNFEISNDPFNCDFNEAIKKV